MAEAGKYVDSDSLSRKVISVAAGEAHTLALTGDGSVYSWGRGTFGRLGACSELDRLFPAKIEFSSKIVQVSAGSYHSLALSDDGSVWSWGHNTYGQLGVNGENSLVPSLVHVFNELHPPRFMTDELITKTETRLQISSVKAGGMMSLAIDNLGSLWMWGNCPPQDSLTEGEGEGEFSLVPTYTPIPVWNFHGQTVVKVACGNEHIVALVSTGETHKGDSLVCYTWGNNNHGQLGLGDTEIRTSPEIVKTFNQESPYTAYEVACGAFHTSVLAKTDGDMLKSVCWSFGLGDHGQLGQGTTNDSLYPEIVEGIPEDIWLISVDCGLFHTSVVSSDGYVWSWGMGNGLGLCPEGSFTESDGGDALTPRLIPCNGLKCPFFQDPVQVACGAAHTVLLADNGYKLWSWGRGRSGVLGNGQVNDFFAPNRVLWPPLEEDFKDSDKVDVEKDSREIRNIKKEPNNAIEEIDLLHSKLSTMEHYASILHGLIFGRPLEEEKDVPVSLKKLDSFDVGKEWENMLESCDYGKLVRLEMFYGKMLAGVKDKMMKVRIKEMIKECLESSTSMHH